MVTISDERLDAWYGADYYGPGTDYFDPPQADPEGEDFDPDWDGWVKPSERE